MTYRIFCAINFMLVSSFSFSKSDFDFVMVTNECKMIVSYNIISDESLKVVKADSPILFCNRNSKAITCSVTHIEESEKMEQKNYILELDSPPFMYFQTSNGSETAYINSNEHAGSYTSRIIGDEFLGYKVCNMTYLTYDQYKALQSDSN